VENARVAAVGAPRGGFTSQYAAPSGHTQVEGPDQRSLTEVAGGEPLGRQRCALAGARRLQHQSNTRQPRPLLGPCGLLQRSRFGPAQPSEIRILVVEERNRRKIGRNRQPRGNRRDADHDQRIVHQRFGAHTRPAAAAAAQGKIESGRGPRLDKRLGFGHPHLERRVARAETLQPRHEPQ
jgi:hypothetical protein